MGYRPRVGDLLELELSLLGEHGLRARIVHRPYAPEATRWLAVELGDDSLARVGGARGEGPTPEAARDALLGDLREHEDSTDEREHLIELIGDLLATKAGGMSESQLSKALDLPAAELARQMNDLEAQGFVFRQRRRWVLG